jgi:glycerophosphoryl diester phosphodiesterase
MQVHPYTFRNEAAELAFDYGVSARAEYRKFLSDMGVDGAFTDFSGTLYDWLLEQKALGTDFDKLL